MNDQDQERGNSGVLGPLLGFVLGAVVGGAVALLWAPASGERTRRELGKAARRVGRDARQRFDDARDAAGDAAADLGANVKSAIHAGRELIQKDGSR